MTNIMTSEGTTLDITALARETAARLASLKAQADAAAKALAEAQQEVQAQDWLTAKFPVKSIAEGVMFSLQEVVAHNQAHKASGMRRNPISEAIYEETKSILDLVGSVKQDGKTVLNGQYWTKIAFIGGLEAGKTLPSRGEADSE